MVNQNLDRVYAKIDLDALDHNVDEILKHLEEETKLLGVVKSDAYGHGSVEVAKLLQNKGVAYFAVATVDEGIVLRQNGISLPILVLGYTFEGQFHNLLKYNLTQAVSSVEEAQKLSEYCRNCDKEVSIHIEVDTGMSRLGFIYHERLVEDIMTIDELSHIKIQGLFTHFSKADEEDKSYTMKQLEQFKALVEAVKKCHIDIPYIHAANSAGVIDHKEAFFDMVRPGISMYGLYPSEDVNHRDVKLKPVLSLHSRVISVKTFPKDTLIGYGGTYKTTDMTKVAVIPVGYGDGYPRRLSEQGRVIIKGQYARILGRVCMDQFMVDVTHISDIAVGDEVVLIGKDGEIEVTTEEIANYVQTINYEIVCQLGRRIPRVYYKNNEITHTLSYL